MVEFLYTALFITAAVAAAVSLRHSVVRGVTVHRQLTVGRLAISGSRLASSDSLTELCDDAVKRHERAMRVQCRNPFARSFVISPSPRRAAA